MYIINKWLLRNCYLMLLSQARNCASSLLQYYTVVQSVHLTAACLVLHKGTVDAPKHRSTQVLHIYRDLTGDLATRTIPDKATCSHPIDWNRRPPTLTVQKAHFVQARLHEREVSHFHTGFLASAIDCALSSLLHLLKL